LGPVERVIRRVEATQQRFTPTAFGFGVVKKFGDDNRGALVPDTRGGLFRRPAPGADDEDRAPRTPDEVSPPADDQQV
jgi:hypothetical protein